MRLTRATPRRCSRSAHSPRARHRALTPAQVVLESVTKHKYLRRPFLDIMRKMLLLPDDPNKGHKQWIILQRIVQQLVAKRDEIRYDPPPQ